MLVKVAPMGEVVTTVNVEAGTTVGEAITIANVMINGRSVMLNNTPTEESRKLEDVSVEHIISLANKQKGGRVA